MDNNDLMEIIKHLTADNKNLKSRIDILEEILSNYLPVVGDNEEQNSYIYRRLTWSWI